MIAPRSDPPPQVTVVIPAYRAKTFIQRAIDSALDQDGVTVEVVVVDDASPDDTAEVVETLAMDRPGLRLVRLAHNGGPSVARNAGLKNARAKWVAILDADDAFEPGRLARLVEAGERYDADVIADNVRYFDALAQSLSEPMFKSCTAPLQLTVHDFTARARPGTGEMDLGLLKPMYRVGFLLEKDLLYPVDIRHGEDFTLYFNLLLAGARFFVLPEAGYHWTLRSSGQSQTRIDYLSQQREAHRLALRPDVQGDHRLVALLKERGRALVDLSLSRRYDEAKRQRNYAKLLTLALRHPTLAKRLFGASVRKVTNVV